MKAAESAVGPNDVLCGRHKDAWNNEGNKRFRKVVGEYVRSYMASSDKQAKTVIVKSIMHIVTKKNGGKFLKQQSTDGTLQELTRKETHNKIGHAIRDQVKQIINKQREEEEDLEDDINSINVEEEMAETADADMSNITDELCWGKRFFFVGDS